MRAVSVPRGDEMDLVRALYDDDSHLREWYARRVVRDRRRAKLRAWRPRFRIVVRVRLFPKTQDRLAALEKDLESARWRLDSLSAQVRDLSS